MCVCVCVGVGMKLYNESEVGEDCGVTHIQQKKYYLCFGYSRRQGLSIIE